MWERVTLCLAWAPGVWEFPLGGCWCVCLWSPEMHRGLEKQGGEACMCAVLGWGAVCFCSWLPEKHPAHASAGALVRQWQRCLAFRARGQGGASHHLPTKTQVTQPASALPHFLPSPQSSPRPTAGPAKKTEGFSPFLPCLSPRAPPQPLCFHGTAPSSLFEDAHFFFFLTALQVFLFIVCVHVWGKE